MESETSSSLGSKSEKSRTLITYDFLGVSSSSLQTQELDLDFHVPSGWKRCLDLKVYKTLHFSFFIKRYCFDFKSVEIVLLGSITVSKIYLIVSHRLGVKTKISLYTSFSLNFLRHLLKIKP